MIFDVRLTLNKCKACAATKVNKYGTERIHPIQTNFPFQRVAIDITGPLPVSREGHRYILGCIDYFTKFPVFVPLKSITIKEVAKALFSRWISFFGAPYSLHSDRRGNVDGELIRQLCTLFNITKSHSAPYQPRGDGLIERQFRTMKDMLKASVLDSGRQWIECLPTVEMGIRSTVQNTTKFSPFEMVFGFPMRTVCTCDKSMGSSQRFIRPHDYITWLQKNLKSIHGKATDQTKIAANKMIQKVKRVSRSFSEGDRVMVRNLPLTKYGPKYDGPYVIICKLNETTFKLQRVKGGKNVERNAEHLKHCYL